MTAIRYIMGFVLVLLLVLVGLDRVAARHMKANTLWKYVTRIHTVMPWHPKHYPDHKPIKVRGYEGQAWEDVQLEPVKFAPVPDPNFGPIEEKPTIADPTPDNFNDIKDWIDTKKDIDEERAEIQSRQTRPEVVEVAKLDESDIQAIREIVRTEVANSKAQGQEEDKPRFETKVKPRKADDDSGKWGEDARDKPRRPQIEQFPDEPKPKASPRKCGPNCVCESGCSCANEGDCLMAWARSLGKGIERVHVSNPPAYYKYGTESGKGVLLTGTYGNWTCQWLPEWLARQGQSQGEVSGGCGPGGCGNSQNVPRVYRRLFRR